eukprot:538337-Rhodomonas_salina.1
MQHTAVRATKLTALKTICTHARAGLPGEATCACTRAGLLPGAASSRLLSSLAPPLTLASLARGSWPQRGRVRRSGVRCGRSGA